MKLEKFKDKSKTKRKVLLISLGVVVLISISFLLFKTFASFSEEVNFPMMSGKVDYFGNSDIYFVFYKNDELLDEMPKVNNSENLVFDHGNCDNDAKIIWNASEWAPLVKGLNKVKTKCELYFAVIPLPTNIQSSDITMSKSTDNWTKEDVEVTLTQNKYQGFILQYRTNKNTTWQDYKGPFKVSENNTIVYVKLKDAKGNESNEYQVGVVDNIDNLAPTNVSYKPIYTIPNNGGEVGFIGYHKINGLDESNETSGASGELKYYFTNDKGETWYPENGLSEEEVKRINEDKNRYYPLANNAGNTYGMKVVDKAGNETITDYTEFTPYDPGTQLIQYVHVDDVNSSEPFDFNFTFEYQGQKLVNSTFKIYLIASFKKVNGEYQYELEGDFAELALEDRLSEGFIENVTDFKTMFENFGKIIYTYAAYAASGIGDVFAYNTTDGQGNISFDSLPKNGIYLLTGASAVAGYSTFTPKPILIYPYDGVNRNPNSKIEIPVTVSE